MIPRTAAVADERKMRMSETNDRYVARRERL